VIKLKNESTDNEYNDFRFKQLVDRVDDFTKDKTLRGIMKLRINTGLFLLIFI
jgi:hypothetical protein